MQVKREHKSKDNAKVMGALGLWDCLLQSQFFSKTALEMHGVRVSLG